MLPILKKRQKTVLDASRKTTGEKSSRKAGPIRPFPCSNTYACEGAETSISRNQNRFAINKRCLQHTITRVYQLLVSSVPPARVLCAVPGMSYARLHIYIYTRLVIIVYVELYVYQEVLYPGMKL